MQFTDFGLSQALVRAIGEEGYDEPTPIQVKAIPHVLEGRDLLGCAQTGTGKTAAFAVPILERLAQNRKHPRVPRSTRVLVLSPTRELASQIADSFSAYGRHTGITNTVVFGGVNQNRQIDALQRGVDVLVATPGRLLDLLGQRAVTLAHVEVFVLDEADRMLDMGFIHDVRKIAAEVPTVRQTLLFSATMPETIRALAAKLLHDPVEVAVTPVASTAETVDQAVYFVEKADKRGLLAWILEDGRIERALVFTRTKHSANRVAEGLDKRGVRAAAIHGNKSQNARERALDGFKRGDVRVLVATDIAARGIDIDQLGLVINYDLPNVPEAYVHRIGRTGRAGAAGQALSFCEAEERPYLADIERLIQMHLGAITDHPFPSSLGVPPKTDLTPKRHGRPSHGTSGRPSQSVRPPQGARHNPPQRPTGQSPRLASEPQRQPQVQHRSAGGQRAAADGSHGGQVQRGADVQRSSSHGQGERQRPQTTRTGEPPRSTQARSSAERPQTQRDGQRVAQRTSEAKSAQRTSEAKGAQHHATPGRKQSVARERTGTRVS